MKLAIDCKCATICDRRIRYQLEQSGIDSHVAFFTHWLCSEVFEILQSGYQMLLCNPEVDESSLLFEYQVKKFDNQTPYPHN